MIINSCGHLFLKVIGFLISAHFVPHGSKNLNVRLNQTCKRVQCTLYWKPINQSNNHIYHCLCKIPKGRNTEYQKSLFYTASWNFHFRDIKPKDVNRHSFWNVRNYQILKIYWILPSLKEQNRPYIIFIKSSRQISKSVKQALTVQYLYLNK